MRPSPAAPQVAFPELGPSCRASLLERRALLAAVVLQLVGLAAITLQRGSVFTRLGAVSDPVLVTLCLGLGAALLAPSTQRTAAWLSPLPFCLPPLFTVLGEHHLPGQLAIASAGARWLTPLVLALWLSWPSRDLRSHEVVLLRVGIALTFIGHGVKAFTLHPPYLELIQASAQNVLDWQPSLDHSAYALRTIGVIDVALGALTLFVGLRAALFYMMLWGAITAASRVTAHGWERVPDVAFRVSHFVAPWVLLRARRVES